MGDTPRPPTRVLQHGGAGEFVATLIGETLSHFEILEFIGKGGFGEVYRARDTDLDRAVALKLLPEAVSADPAGRARFRREARAASRLSHPNVCTIYEFGEQGTRTFIAMELVAGRTLKERIRESPFAPMEALDVAIQIAEGLASAHAMGILHLDIKSANIVLTPSGNVKILDFGLARLATFGEPPQETQTPGLGDGCRDRGRHSALHGAGATPWPGDGSPDRSVCIWCGLL
jgi:eukaryotic-like serine/threonine-protein kinase